MSYPGLAYIGSGKISGLYGLNETIHDQKSTGLQHLYVDDYEKDLIYSATTVLKVLDTCYYGDSIKPIAGHPRKQRSSKSYSENGYIFVDVFDYDDFEKIDRVCCVEDYTLAFSCEVINKSNLIKEVSLSALLVTTSGKINLIENNGVIEIDFKDKFFQFKCFDDALKYRLSVESPSGFMYHGIQDILYESNDWNGEFININGSVALSASKKVALEPGATYKFNWGLDFSKKGGLSTQDAPMSGDLYWNKWLEKTTFSLDDKLKVNLIALKAINLNGFMPADLTGHYFANNDIAFYVRDALHGAKAFMLCGFFEECKMILDLVMRLERKRNHELFQRYNSKLIPDEGANNNVFSQIDVIGYLLSIVVDYFELTGELLVNVDRLVEETEILENIQMKNGLYGPEGGVNEGVYGPAFITSTNIFIAAGLNRLLYLMERLESESEKLVKVREKLDGLKIAINNTFLEEGYFGYGFVDYHDQIIKRYDTPQLFGAGLGYPIDEKYKKSFETLTEIATYFGYGYGYSEQQYHDGPWLFNTCYAAQNAFMMNDTMLYSHIMDWIETHRNDYGLLPEAVDARDENNAFINPLMWANAEYLCAKQVSVLSQLRKG